jgi:hypothetical protein
MKKDKKKKNKLKKKNDKLDKVIEKLRYHVYRNYQWCHHNDCEETDYIKGVNDICISMVEFTKKLKKKK